MRTHRVFLPALLIFFSAAHVYGGDVVSPGFSFPDSAAGVNVDIPGTFTDPGVRTIVLENTKPGIPSPPAIATTLAGEILSFSIPNDLPSDRYFVKIVLGKADPVYAGELRVLPLPAVQVTIATVRPISPYPNPSPQPAPSPDPKSSPVPSPTPFLNQYDFEIAGTNFSPILANNHIEIDDVATNIRPCEKDGPVTCLGNERGSETRKLIVYRYSPLTALRPLSVSVRVGDSSNVAKAPTPLVFSSVSKRTLQLYAVGSFAILLGILFLLVGAGLKLGKIDKEKFGSLKAFILDKETNSYSLSKLQLTLFTLVTVFGYIYVFVCTLWVQGKFELPPVPENLPGMMAISVGTSVVAAGIGSRIGGKGAGPTSPSIADFITSGGVVLPERFQFFLWTLVSAGGVLALILASDPVTLTQLPKLPEGLLYLMGLSSAGYLGGKLVRGPGPSVKSLDAQLIQGNVVKFILNGDNLSTKATFQLDGEHIPVDQVQIGEKTLQGQDLELCSTLEVRLSNVAQRYLDGPHLFRIVNPDSQGADFTYGATIEAATATEAGDENFSDQFANYVVKGTNFKDPSSAQWIDAAGTVTKLGPESVAKKSDTELVVSLPLGVVPAKISIVSPGGLATTFDITSGAHVETPTAAAATIQSSEIGQVDIPEKPAEDGKPAEPAYTALEVTLTGDNLSSEAAFDLDGEPVPGDQVIVVDKRTPATLDPKLWKELEVRLKNVDPRFYDGPRVLRITNPFSPGVDIKYGAKINSVGPVAAGDAPVPVTVTGENFQDLSSAVWTSSTDVPTEISADQVTKVSATQLNITLIPGPAGPATLTIKSPGNLTTNVDVTVT